MPIVKRRKPEKPARNAFPLAASYLATRPATHARLRERPVPAFTERHLQAVWFDREFRPATLTTLDGEPVTVQQPGRWNLEAGPDFLDARLVVGSDRRALHGDVEIHTHPGDWKQHGHGRDPLYRQVVAHVCYWTGRLPPADLPAHVLQIALKPALDADPGFHFSNIDVTAYPYAVPPPSGARQAPLADLPAADAVRWLHAAGQARLQEKAERLAASIQADGPAQALYEGVMAALGYQHNRGTCRRLACRLTVERLREESRGSPVVAYALLLGVAGLMPRTAGPDWDAETRAFVRALWDAWWKLQARWDVFAFSRQAWRLAGTRPLNHPARRLAVAAALFTAATPAHAALAQIDTSKPARALTQLADLLRTEPAWPYWERRASIGGKPAREPIALLGESRRTAMLLNVVLPFLAAQGRTVAPLLAGLPAESGNQITRQTAHLIFGPDYNPAVFATGLAQQGLLQLFHDYCLPNRLDELPHAASLIGAPAPCCNSPVTLGGLPCT